MRKRIAQKLTFDREVLSESEAKRRFATQPFKLELIRDLVTKGTTLFDELEKTPAGKPSATITAYTTGSFVDLCRGGHVESTKDIPADAFRLMRVAGAYWRGSEKNPMLQRIYGAAFASKEELEKHLSLLAEAEKRDHKKLGPELELFLFHPTAPGMPYWLPKGVTIMNELIRFWREEHGKRGYQEIISPLLNKKSLYVTSGHVEHYWNDMFVVRTDEGDEYGVKAMNCPNAMIVYGSRQYSYKDLPVRLSDTDTLHRNERSGTLNGLLRARVFRQDDAHIFVTEDQIGSEYGEVFSLVKRFYAVFDMPYEFRLGTRPMKFLGDRATWDRAEETLRRILKKSKRAFTVAEGDGAFYGPKVDILVNDALGREWQMGTIQLDFQQPKRFHLSYIARDGSHQTPVAIHRVIYGSLERFMGILIEHYAGAFPLWLAPVQIAIIPVSVKHARAVRKLGSEFQNIGFRVEIFPSDQTVGYSIRRAEKQRIPFTLVIGDKEAGSSKLHIRDRGKKKIRIVTKSSFVAELRRRIDRRK